VAVEQIPFASDIVTGAYAGNDAGQQTIDLGFTPKWVLYAQNGMLGTIGLATPGHPIINNNRPGNTGLEITYHGFVVYYDANLSLLENYSGYKHYFIAGK
jgi:hypothetical protein